MTDQGARHLAPQTAADMPGEVAQRLRLVASRRSRGTQWYAVEDLEEVVRFADERIGLLQGDLDRKGREITTLTRQVEMLRHGTLPSVAPQGADPMAVELTMRAQEEANRTIGDASDEGAEILAEARRQADDIIAAAHQQANRLARLPSRSEPEPTVPSTPPTPDLPAGQVADLQRQLRELRERHAAVLAAANSAQQHLSQWQTYLTAQAEQLQANAVTAATASERLQAAIKE
ncbi:hypothetical protein ABT336_14070 [Micromonospora sp. NPDC000207]|uniref:hypothetical protein n=1 Tax=Micromonospora sp. NPDC000207 TaxID=3154246 RepID=UPI0033266C03